MIQSTAKILISCFKDPFIPGRNVWKQAPSFIRLKGRAHHEFWHTSLLLFFFHFYFPASLHFSTMNVWNIPFLNILLTSYLKTSLRRECQSELHKCCSLCWTQQGLAEYSAPTPESVWWAPAVWSGRRAQGHLEQDTGFLASLTVWHD